MKNMKKVIVALISLTVVNALSAGCYECSKWKLQCSGAGNGRCLWEGGIICTGVGTCSETDPIQTPIAECIEKDGGPFKSCETRNFEQIYNKCYARCPWVAAFLSCNCETTGGDGSSVIEFPPGRYKNCFESNG